MPWTSLQNSVVSGKTTITTTTQVDWTADQEIVLSPTAQGVSVLDTSLLSSNAVDEGDGSSLTLASSLQNS